MEVWPNPIEGEVNLSFEIKTEGNVKISLQSLVNLNQSEITLSESQRPIGAYSEKYFTTDIPKGLYVLSVVTEEYTAQKKIIIR